MDFYLGSDVAGLGWGEPVMVSHGRLRERRTLPRATAPWVCDSRGFTELSQHGRWTFGPVEYAAALRRYAAEVGQLQWASPQDWMCEPKIRAKTGKTIAEHQKLTTESVLTLRSLGPGTHVIPVLQGWELADYLTHIYLYADYGIDLRAEPVVGLGSVCRRQATREIHAIVSELALRGLRLHGFGVKTAAIARVGHLLASADSGAWSYGARRRIVHCDHGLTDWAQNCPKCAIAWRDNITDTEGRETVTIMTKLAPPLRVDCPRDRFKRPTLDDPTTGERTTYQRVTTLAGMIDDQYNLTLWKMRKVARGIAWRDDLRIAAATTDDNDRDGKAALDEICEKALDAAGGGAGASMGTAFHRVAQIADAYPDVAPESFCPPELRAELTAYLALVRHHELRLSAEYQERTGICVEAGTAGTWDDLGQGGTACACGRWHVVDKKSGQHEFEYGQGKIAAQLAMYARFVTLWRAAGGGYEDVPDICPEVGYVIHVPIGRADEAAIYPVDLLAGWERVRTAMDVRDKRSQKRGLFGPALTLPGATTLNFGVRVEPGSVAEEVSAKPKRARRTKAQIAADKEATQAAAATAEQVIEDAERALDTDHPLPTVETGTAFLMNGELKPGPALKYDAGASFEAGELTLTVSGDSEHDVTPAVGRYAVGRAVAVELEIAPKAGAATLPDVGKVAVSADGSVFGLVDSRYPDRITHMSYGTGEVMATEMLAHAETTGGGWMHFDAGTTCPEIKISAGELRRAFVALGLLPSGSEVTEAQAVATLTDKLGAEVVPDPWESGVPHPAVTKLEAERRAALAALKNGTNAHDELAARERQALAEAIMQANGTAQIETAYGLWSAHWTPEHDVMAVRRLISITGTRKGLDRIWETYQSVWTDDLTAAGNARLAELARL